MNSFVLLFTFILIKIYFIPLSTQSREISLRNFEITFLEISKSLSIELSHRVSDFVTTQNCNFTSSYELSRHVVKQSANTSIMSPSEIVHTSKTRSSLYFSSELFPFLGSGDIGRFKDILPVSFGSKVSDLPINYRAQNIRNTALFTPNFMQMEVKLHTKKLMSDYINFSTFEWSNFQ